MTVPLKPELEKNIGEEEVSVRDLAMIVAEHLKLLIAGPLLVAIVAFGLGYGAPKLYTSEAYFAPVSDREKAVRQWMELPTVLDKVSSMFPGLFPARQKLLDRIKWRDADGGIIALSVSDEQAERAQAINTALIETWIAQSKPGPEQTKLITQQIELVDQQLSTVTSLIDRLTTETPQLIIPGMESELATPLASLRADRNGLVTQKENLQRRLLGVSRDVVVVPPTLPTDSASPSKVRSAAIAAVATAVVLLLFVFITTAMRSFSGDLVKAMKNGSIRKSLIFWRSSSS